MNVTILLADLACDAIALREGIDQGQLNITLQSELNALGFELTAERTELQALLAKGATGHQSATGLQAIDARSAIDLNRYKHEAISEERALLQAIHLGNLTDLYNRTESTVLRCAAIIDQFEADHPAARDLLVELNRIEADFPRVPLYNIGSPFQATARHVEGVILGKAARVLAAVRAFQATHPVP